MLDVDTVIADCRAALNEAHPMVAVKEIVERVVADRGAAASALRAKPGVEILHRSADLTVVSVVVPAGAQPTLPHDHRMWAVVGVYQGQEDNRFFRRAENGLAESGGRSLHGSDALAMGDDTIHAICNPLSHESLAAIHVYGGDLLGSPRSMWTEPGFREEPYDDTKVLGSRIRE